MVPYLQFSRVWRRAFSQCVLSLSLLTHGKLWNYLVICYRYWFAFDILITVFTVREKLVRRDMIIHIKTANAVEKFSRDLRSLSSSVSVFVIVVILQVLEFRFTSWHTEGVYSTNWLMSCSNASRFRLLSLKHVLNTKRLLLQIQCSFEYSVNKIVSFWILFGVFVPFNWFVYQFYWSHKQNVNIYK